MPVTQDHRIVAANPAPSTSGTSTIPPSRPTGTRGGQVAQGPRGGGFRGGRIGSAQRCRPPAPRDAGQPAPRSRHGRPGGGDEQGDGGRQQEEHVRGGRERAEG